MLSRQETPTLRAWIRRPGALRVESADGNVYTSTANRPFHGAKQRTGGGPWERIPGRWPTELTPVFDEHGLVTSLPESTRHQPAIDWDDPMHQDYRWVAMLNPLELADPVHDSPTDTVGPPVELSEVVVVDHHDRPAWETVATPKRNYDPRCDCCSLLMGCTDEETYQWVPGPPTVVRLDVETGVCVYLEPAEPNRTHGLNVRILEVDEPMDDSLFERTRFARRLFGRS